MKSILRLHFILYQLICSFTEKPKVIQYNDGESIEFSFGDADIDYDLEMLQNKELASFNLAAVKEKLQRLHDFIQNSDSHVISAKENQNEYLIGYNKDDDDDGEDKNYGNDSDTNGDDDDDDDDAYDNNDSNNYVNIRYSDYYYANSPKGLNERPVQEYKRQIEENLSSNTLNTSLITLNSSSEDSDYVYDYEAFRQEYYGEIQSVPIVENNTVIFNGTENEEVFEAITKPPLNCNNSEHWRYGFKEIKCVWHNITEPQTKKDVTTAVYSLGKLLIFWFTVYVIIAVTLWAVKGWCCCCCRCQICFTERVMSDIKYYMTANPPGVIVNDDGTIITYEPSDFEVHEYMQLKRAIYGE